MTKLLRIYITFIFIYALICGHLFGQVNFEGWIKDDSTNKALPFVNIVFYPSGYGTVSDMNGYFKVILPENTDSIEISYLGYEDMQLDMHQTRIDTPAVIKIRSKPLEIEELFFSPKENPANLVIDKVIEHRTINDPLEKNAFSYIAYEKMYFTYDTTTPVLLSNQFVFNNPDHHYLFLLENLTQTKYKRPDLIEEKIIASRASGFKNPSLVLLISHLQSFSFYKDEVRLGSIKYYNPISKDQARYRFKMLDTLASITDTIYVIAFTPENKSCSQCLKGFVHINSDQWAIQHIVAEAAITENDNMGLKIQQKYERVNARHWFPSQYHVMIKFNQNKKSTNKEKIIAVGTTFITNVRVNPELKRSDFEKYNITVASSSNEIKDSLLAKYRTDTLTMREQETYRVIDSIGEVYYFEPIFYGIEHMFNGFLPMGAMDLNLSQIIDYNEFEGLRLGMGLRTNRKLSHRFRVGGYVTYGFKDKRYKYGAESSLFFDACQSSGISFLYRKDLEEAGDIKFLENITLSSSEYFRHFFVSTKVQSISRKISLYGDPIRYLRTEVYISTLDIEELQNYSYAISEIIPTVSVQNFLFTDIGFRIRFAFGEERILTPEHNIFVRESNYPVVWFNLEQSTKAFHGQYNISRMSAKIKAKFHSGILGITKFTLLGGIATGNPPLYKLFNGRGSYQTLGIDADNTFATMRINEFYSDRFISLFHKQHLGSIRIFRKFTPEFTWNNNAGIGSIENKSLHEGMIFNTLEKGYLESGIVIDNLIRIPMFRYGFGIYYRYGPYTFDRINRNFAYNLSIKLAI